MKKVTALKVQKRNPKRVSVYLDGEYAFGLARIVAGWLHLEQELSEEKIAELLTSDQIEVAMQRAGNFLSYRPRSELEVRQNLNKHQVDENIIAQVVHRLKRDHLINDEEFARMWVENRSEFRPRGKRLLRYELYQKGIDEQIIQNVLQYVDEEKLASQAARKQAQKYRNLEWPDFRKKMSGFLARRGFNYEVISLTIQNVWEDHLHSPQEYS